VADAHCTLTSDLGGIYFAVQANYERQFVSANQQALNAGIREDKAAFAHALKTMPTLLQTTSATPNLPGPPATMASIPARPSPHPVTPDGTEPGEEGVRPDHCQAGVRAR
jgi:hypothetical protein